ncbi:ABC transporter ATP-binding protein [Enterobacterales bacterium CwR94]|nr:ABC transporter ATP-binding protein [Enterobacterales bacterium CwR94]
MKPLLIANEISVWGVAQHVAPISLTLHAGLPLTLIGETGSGKSLIAQALMGSLPPELRAEGTLQIGEQKIDVARQPLEHRALWGNTLSALPQEPWLALDPTMRSRQQVREGARYVRGLTPAQSDADAEQRLAEVGLAQHARAFPWQLSGGMAQRVAFAAARAGGAQILIADEPTKGLDTERRDDVGRLLLSEVQQGGALLTITHDIALARQLGGEVAVIRQGQVVERGLASQVLEHPQHAYTRKLLAADPACWPETSLHPVAQTVVIEAQSVTLSRGGHRLFEQQCLQIHAGEIVGISGPSGSGKSSFGDVLLSLISPCEGQIQRQPGIAKVRFQKLYQDPPSAFAPQITLRQSLQDVIQRHQLDERDIGPLMADLALAPTLLERTPATLSGGELQRFALLRILLLKPVFIFADEPTSRLDPVVQQQTLALLTRIARERQCAVVLVSHDPHLLAKSTHRVITLSKSDTEISDNVTQRFQMCTE